MEKDTLLRLAFENDDEDLIFFLILPNFGPTTYDPDVPRFNLHNFTDVQCVSNFRFDKQSIHRLAAGIAFTWHDPLSKQNCSWWYRCVVYSAPAIFISQ